MQTAGGVTGGYHLIMDKKFTIRVEEWDINNGTQGDPNYCTFSNVLRAVIDDLFDMDVGIRTENYEIEIYTIENEIYQLKPNEDLHTWLCRYDQHTPDCLPMAVEINLNLGTANMIWRDDSGLPDELAELLYCVATDITAAYEVVNDTKYQRDKIGGKTDEHTYFCLRAAKHNLSKAIELTGWKGTYEND